MESPLGSDLARLVRIWRALIDHRLKPLELTQTHWVTLHNIHQLPPDQSQIQLAKAIGIEQPSLVRTLDQLEEKGLNLQSKCNKKRSTHQLEYNFVSTQKPLPNDEYFLPTSYNKRARKDNDFTRTGQKTSRNCQSTGT